MQAAQENQPVAESQAQGNAVQTWLSNAKRAPEWPYILTDLLLKGACALFYFFCNWFTKSFILHFVVETVLIVVDFWFTKNIGGRRLVGMRWWHIPSQEGSTTWRFEHKGLEDPTYKPSRAASSNFWGSMILLEIFWTLMCVFALQKPGYLILCGMGFAFTATNINGYWKCRSWSSAKLPESQQDSLNTGMPNLPGGLSQGAANALMQGAISSV